MLSTLRCSPSRIAKDHNACTRTLRSFISRPTRPSWVVPSLRLPSTTPPNNAKRRFGDNSNDEPSLPRQFLEAYDDMNFDPLTHQRNDVLFDPVDGKPPLPSVDTQPLNLKWKHDEDKDTTKQDDDNEASSTSTVRSKNWIRFQKERWRMNPTDFDCTWSDVQAIKTADSEVLNNDRVKRVLWSNWTEDIIRDKTVSPILFEYDNLRNEKQSKLGNNKCDTEKKKLLKALYQYGLVLVTGTPSRTDSLTEEFIDPSLPKSTNNKESAESAILHLTSLIGYHPLQTLYGPGVWSTSSKSSFYNEESDGTSASTADSAYGSTSLPLHTDMTYMASPPGVQVFLMVQPATSPDSKAGIESGDPFTPTGQSVYLDGFAAARQLQIENPRAFDILASTTRQYRCIDDNEGWHMQASGPVIEAMPLPYKGWGLTKSIRHNDLDRLPDLPPYPRNKDINDKFYNQLREAHEAWDNVLRRDSMRLVIGLQPGDCVLVSNQRVMHGRYAFDASYYPRVVMGCYVGIDELLSKLRTNGFRVM